MTKLSFTLAVAAFASASAYAQADLLFEESFFGAVGDQPSGWTSVAGDFGPAGPIAADSLTYSGLLSSGNHWAMDNGVDTLTQKFTSTPLGAGGTFYYSVLINLDSGYTGAGNGKSLFSLLGGTAPAAGLSIAAGSSSDTYRLVFSYGDHGASNTKSYTHPAEYDVGQTMLLVASYTFDSGLSSFWVNPSADTLGAATAPSPYHTMSTAVASRAIDTFQIFNGTFPDNGLPPTWSMDELRIGTTWASVTPVPEPSSVAAIAAACAGIFVLRRRRRA